MKRVITALSAFALALISVLAFTASSAQAISQTYTGTRTNGDWDVTGYSPGPGVHSGGCSWTADRNDAHHNSDLGCYVTAGDLGDDFCVQVTFDWTPLYYPDSDVRAIRNCRANSTLFIPATWFDETGYGAGAGWIHGVAAGRAMIGIFDKTATNSASDPAFIYDDLRCYQFDTDNTGCEGWGDTGGPVGGPLSSRIWRLGDSGGTTLLYGGGYVFDHSS